VTPDSRTDEPFGNPFDSSQPEHALASDAAWREPADFVSPAHRFMSAIGATTCRRFLRPNPSRQVRPDRPPVSGPQGYFPPRSRVRQQRSQALKN
jgi:hypothetical protein